ncbi:hypothetical protein [Streptomyces sp. NPDC020607]|uniref:hypothetical protein n=1 Tax=Streptomyces sp. NPDC020607 TaxID=3365082 RepID=UPI0037AD9B82
MLRNKETSHKRLLVDRLKTSPRLSSKDVPMPPYLLEALQEYMERYPPRATETVLWEHKKKISTCLQGGIPEHTVATWVGDSVVELRRTYSHLLKDHAETHGARPLA